MRLDRHRPAIVNDMGSVGSPVCGHVVTADGISAIQRCRDMWQVGLFKMNKLAASPIVNAEQIPIMLKREIKNLPASLFPSRHAKAQRKRIRGDEVCGVGGSDIPSQLPSLDLLSHVDTDSFNRFEQSEPAAKSVMKTKRTLGHFMIAQTLDKIIPCVESKPKKFNLRAGFLQGSGVFIT
jgi:hypothetical protein